MQSPAWLDLNVALCRALGLDENKVLKISIVFDGGSPPKAEIERLIVDDEDVVKVRHVFEHYTFAVSERTQDVQEEVAVLCQMCGTKEPCVCNRDGCPGYARMFRTEAVAP